MQTFNLEQLRACTQSGGVLGITLTGQGASFIVNVQTQRGPATMVKSRGHEPRCFADPRKAMQVLRELGLTHFEIDTSAWRPEEHAQIKVRRPDRSAALKATHEAAEHDRWFRAKVQGAIDGLANGSNQVLSDEQTQAYRADLRARLKASAKK